jgi:hypothetical protein
VAEAQLAVRLVGEELDTGGAFGDTAAVMKGLDLVVSADTATAHLAGALGVPVWLALSQVCDWRWCANGRTPPGIRACGCGGRSGWESGGRCSRGWERSCETESGREA